MVPFKYGSVVSGKNFCGRQDLIDQLADYIQSFQNVVVQGERRIGKTSLIYETTRRMPRCAPIFIDIMGIKSTRDLCQRMIKAVLSAEKKAALLTRALKMFGSLRPRLGVDPLTGLPTITLDPSVELNPEFFEEIVDWIGSIKKKNMLVVFDEFQDVLNLPEAESILAVLRSKIQYHAQIAYIFSGSMRSRMDEIFTQPDSPLFKAAIPISIGPIAQEEFVKFLQQKFAVGNRHIPDSLISRIFEETDGVTGDIQQMCEVLWSVTSYGSDLTEDDYIAAYKLIFSRESSSYELILKGLTALQVQCLSALARVGGNSVNSGDFLKESGIKQPSSVNRAISKLLKIRVLFIQGKEYRFVNPFFRAWIVARDT